MTTPIAFLDFETTGFEPTLGHRPTEVALVFVQDQKIVDRFESLMNPGRDIPPNVVALTGISNAMAQRAPPVSEVFGEIVSRTRGVPLVAHYATFERKYLQSEFHKIGRKFSNELYCTVRIAKRIYPNSPDYKLASLARYRGLSFSGNAHRAMPDAEMTARLWIDMEFELQREYNLASIPLELMDRLQSLPIREARNYLGRYAERQRKTRESEEARPTSKQRGSPHRANKRPIKHKRMEAKSSPKSTKPREIPADLLPENIARPPKRRVLTIPEERKRRIGNANSRRQNRRSVGSFAPKQPENSTRTRLAVKCMYCSQSLANDGDDAFPWLRCPVCSQFTPKPLTK